MKEHWLISIYLGLTFIVFFFLTTAISDMIARNEGYYSQGIQDDQNLREEWQ